MSRKGFTSFHIASEVKDARVLGWLLIAANPDSLHAKSVDGNTPAMGASIAGHIDNLNLLIENGSDLWALNNKGMNWFDHIAFAGHTELFKWVFNEWKKNVAIPDTQNQKLWVHLACFTGQYI